MAAKDERLAEQEQARQETLAEERASAAYLQPLPDQLREHFKQTAKKAEKKVEKKIKKTAKKAAERTFWAANSSWLIPLIAFLFIAFLIFLTIFAICTSKNVLVQAGVWVAGFNDLCSAFRQ